MDGDKYYRSTKVHTKGQTISKVNYGFLNSPKKQTKLTILSKEHALTFNVEDLCKICKKDE